jgi:hypothetical protein
LVTDASKPDTAESPHYVHGARAEPRVELGAAAGTRQVHPLLERLEGEITVEVID